MSKFYKINIITIAAVTAIIIGCMAFFPRSSGISKTETRHLATFPEFSFESYFEGEYTEGISKWFSDTIPERELILDIASNIRELYGTDYIAKNEKGEDVEINTDNVQEGIDDERPDGNVSDPLA
ncbi:MAG: hypothetical protein IJN86_02150 [Clostridia bacterium]|nr:hypothetical protein [Clostridia bacterium]MBQ7047727.1 hypothetical protein [Clostridia bacterium]